jgi:hypothetical protein
MGKKKKAKIPRSLQRKRRERKRSKNAVQKSQDNLISKAKARSSTRNVVVSPSEVPKMSEVIMEFAEPLMEHAKTMQDQKKVLTMAIALWNLSMLPHEKRAEEIETLIENLGGTEADPREDVENRNLVQLFMKRKDELFQDIERFILDYDMVETPEGVHLNVVSSLSEGETALMESKKNKGKIDSG